MTITEYILEFLKITTPLFYSSSLNPAGEKDELILNLCRKTNASHYISGPLGRNYLREDIFHKRNITIGYNNYQHHLYPQLGKKQFEPYMSVLDLIFNCGSESYEILMKDQEKIF